MSELLLLDHRHGYTHKDEDAGYGEVDEHDERDGGVVHVGFDADADEIVFLLFLFLSPFRKAEDCVKVA